MKKRERIGVHIYREKGASLKKIERDSNKLKKVAGFCERSKGGRGDSVFSTLPEFKNGHFGEEGREGRGSEAQKGKKNSWSMRSPVKANISRVQQGRGACNGLIKEKNGRGVTFKNSAVSGIQEGGSPAAASLRGK